MLRHISVTIFPLKFTPTRPHINEVNIRWGWFLVCRKISLCDAKWDLNVYLQTCKLKSDVSVHISTFTVPRNPFPVSFCALVIFSSHFTVCARFPHFNHNDVPLLLHNQQLFYHLNAENASINLSWFVFVDAVMHFNRAVLS